MNGKTLFEGVALTTQKPQALDVLAAYLNKPIQDGVLDLGSLKLARSNRGDAFYVVSATGCSCPSAFYNHDEPCKHQRKYFAESMPHGQSMAQTFEEHDRNLHKMPKTHIPRFTPSRNIFCTRYLIIQE